MCWCEQRVVVHRSSKGETVQRINYTKRNKVLRREFFAENQQLKGADTDSTPATLEVTFGYDALGRRVSRSESGNTVIYLQSGQQTIADYTSGAVPASPTYRYVYGSYIDEPLLRETVTGSIKHFFHRNQQYSITALTNSSGDTAERYSYTAYGGLSIFDSG